jgi:hypothetical protein
VDSRSFGGLMQHHDEWLGVACSDYTDSYPAGCLNPHDQFVERNPVSEYGSQPQTQASYGVAPQQNPYGNQPQQNPYGNQPQQYQGTGGSGLIGKRRNPLASWLGLPLITLGIYGLVWIFKTNKELSLYDSRIKVNPTLSVLAFFPGFLLLFIPPLVAMWRLGTRVEQAQRTAGVPTCTPALAFILWVFVANTGVLYLQAEINKIWDRYAGAQEGQQVPHFG